MSPELQVQVPHGMAWCTGGDRVVPAAGGTLAEVWSNLAEAYPELMWRLSTEAGERSEWVRIAVDGRQLPQTATDESLEGAHILTLTVIEGAPTAAPMGSRNPF